MYGLSKPLGLIENSLNDFSKVTCVLSNGNFIDGKVSSLLYQICQDILHEDTIRKFDGSVGEYILKRSVYILFLLRFYHKTYIVVLELIFKETFNLTSKYFAIVLSSYYI